MTYRGKRYHLVGIGGTGMSGLASLLLAQGVSVSGSDISDSSEVRVLQRAGANIHLGHHDSHVDGSLDGIIVSSAISPDNVEVLAAKKREIPVVHRLHAVASLLKRHRSIGIAGTHGKTTTSAMLATILRETGQDPSFLIGAQCSGLGGNARLGRGKWFVAEIDESDGLFVSIRPTIAVVTNVGRDHLYTYESLADIERAFGRYVGQAEHAVLAIDDVNVRRMAESMSSVLTVGIDHPADLGATNLRFDRFTTAFDLVHRGCCVAECRLPAPGKHNVQNALCALGAAHLAGVDLRSAAAALESFVLPHRRFELLDQNGVIVVDDYAHLPEEVSATLAAIRTGWPERRIVAVFQPHRYTRTRDVGQEFGNAFTEADVVIVTDIYAACERPIPGVSSRTVVEAIQASGGTAVYSIPKAGDALAFLEERIVPGDFVISFGAGDVWTVTDRLSTILKQRRSQGVMAAQGC